MACPERTKQVQEAISNHLKTVGACDWEDVKKDFPDVSTASFWRYVKAAKEQLNRPSAPTVASDLFAPREDTPDHSEPWEKPDLNQAFRMLKHGERFYELYADILALRQHALDATGTIRDPQLFAKSIRLRNQLLNDEIGVVDWIRDADHMTNFYQAIVDTITKESPETMKAVMGALVELDQAMKKSIQPQPK